MKRIYIRKKGEESGHVFKSRYSVLEDKVAMFPFLFVTAGILAQSDWAQCQETIADKYELYISETNIDGRSKLAKSMRTFSWRSVFFKEPIKRLHKKSLTKFHK